MVIGVYYILQNQGADYDGQITIIIHDGNQIVTEDVVSYSKGETLLDIMNEEFDLVCANASYKPSNECQDLLFGSPVILEIDDLKTNWKDNYFAIYINDNYSNLGIEMISLIDGDIIQFKVLDVGDE
jgi:hypothetical protein